MAERKKAKEVIEDLKENTVDENRYIWGWNDAQEVANTVWNSIHDRLLTGELVFAYRNTVEHSDLHQAIIVRHNDTQDFSVGVLTNSYSYLLPHMPLEFVKENMISDFEKYKVDKKVLEAFKQIINKF